MYPIVSFIVVNGEPEAHLTNEFSKKIQTPLKINFVVIPFHTIKSIQIFAHATTAMLLWHVQNFVVNMTLECHWEKNEISSNLRYDGKNHEWNGSKDIITDL